MKIRNGFISNSSSSSFVVISDNPDTIMKWVPKKLLKERKVDWDPDRIDLSIEFPNTEGNLHFGWEFKRYKDFLSKCNYAVAQFITLDDTMLKYKYEEMFNKVLRKHVNYKGYLKVMYDYNYFHWDSVIDEDCYVDHQSAYYEYNEKAHYIFQSEENLENFLFNKESFIQCGNDNNDPSAKWVEACKMKGSEYAFRYGRDDLEAED